ncbi:exodeoxyribonuclease V subunit gamma [Halothiobacillus sp. DCM-1]|uniref:exodeoxyribonuclease V subunit gamma n=1 Tax=Halothiobacillus sp. DCM-1 TaxID=3112558 RepID=UPI00324D4A83
MSGITPGFLLLQSNDLDALRSILVDWLKRAPLPALVDETVLIQSNGMAQWLRLGLCQPRERGGLGVSLGVSLEFPARVQWRCYRSVLGSGQVPEHSPFDKSPLLWRLMRVLPGLLDDPRFAVFHRQIKPLGVLDTTRLYELCARLADQWDAYQVYRADWLLHWARGQDDLPSGERPLPEESLWQPVLWRAVLDDVAMTHPDGVTGRVGLHQAFMSRARQIDERPADFPPRLIVFGVSSLAPQVLEVLSVAARWSQVIVCVQNPCQVYWADMLPDLPGKPLMRDRQQNHPLLAAWGRQGRDLLRLLMTLEDQRFSAAEPAHSAEAFVEIPEPRSILQHIQHDMLLGRSRESLLEARRCDPPDGSLVFQSVHSPLRAVEVLHDQLLAEFAADPSLEPQQIIVMMPDIAAYAPAVFAIFGRFTRSDPRYIPFAVADQPEQNDQAQRAMLERLFALPQSRFERSELLEWLAEPTIRAAFCLSDQDAAQLAEWLDQAQVFWGLTPQQRAEFGAPLDYTPHSTQFGLDRLYAGYLMGDAGPLWQGIAPLESVEVAQAELIGKLDQFLAALAEARAFFSDPHTPADWVVGLHGLLPRFFQADTDETSTQLWLARIRTALAEWQDECSIAAWQEALPAGVVLAVLDERLSSHRLTQKFLMNGVNFATLMPMRAIPYRQVYLLGMDDAAYPRRRPRQDFDLMADRYRPGDRARQEDDRYLFLEALLAAREKLSISWVGRAVKDNSPRSPSIVVRQLLDYLDECWKPAADRAFGQSLITEHPLHPFSSAYFDGQNPSLYSFDSDWRRVHDGSTEGGQLPCWIPEQPCTLADLGKFLRDPQDPSMRLRFGIGKPWIPETTPDHEPFTLDGLSRWQLRSALAQRLRTDCPADQALEDWFVQTKQEWFARGQIPWRFAHWEAEIVSPLRAQWQAWQQRQCALGVVQNLPERCRALPDIPVVLQCPALVVRAASDEQWVCCRWMDSALRSKNHGIRYEKCLEFWPEHLAAQLEGVAVSTFLLGNNGDVIVLQPLPSDEAERHLSAILKAWIEGLQAPLPLAPNAAIAYVLAKDGHLDKARAAYAGSGEDQTQSDLQKLPWLARFWPDWESFIAASASCPNAGFAELARQLYEPLIHSAAVFD